MFLPRLLPAHRLLAGGTLPLLLFPRRSRLALRPAVAMSTSSSSAAAPPAPARRAPLRGVVFDMDGTLTVPVIDFPAMYREVLGGEAAYAAARAAGGGAVDILHCIESWGPDEQRRAYEAIARFERDGLDRLQIMPGASELCGFLDARQIRRGLITRNVKGAVDLFHQRFGMMFVPALSREFRPYKPDPAPLLHICSTWKLPPNEVIMVGDSLKDDIVCGKRAGAFTCLLDETGRYGPHDSLPEDVKPDFMVSSLSEVLSVLEEHFDLDPVLSADSRI
ncbi:haloacid dehalogenase-like hydrolase domain-containing protein At2g33255 [Lolium perenne]|uniref:haloacid dehalogenase-like hydrolase domain-containing protein At2g33255 n=1 Tax=Lolium perenne TaxID=4522 RepID=UPI0021F5EA6E|nr:haloacid dehalogenase-like hydrolase domain-containing protein At2g33255 isoform X1 [Lolium perenne]